MCPIIFLSRANFLVHALTPEIYLNILLNKVNAVARARRITLVPTDLGRLRVLILFGNGLLGTIPGTIRNLSQLEVLDLSYNILSNEILPELLENMHNLHTLALDNNELSGYIPTNLFNNSLSEVHLPWKQQLISVGSLPLLVYLDLQENQLSGTVPINMFNMSLLQFMSLRLNNLTWPTLSNQSVSLPELRKLYLQKKNFAGGIPLQLSACQHLQVLSLAYNSFSDTVPKWLAQMPPHLTELLLGQNHFVGSIPAVLGNLTSLTLLDLSFNNLKGVIPTELGLMRELTYLHLRSNQLITGPIPSSLRNLSKLNNLILQENSLSGSVPDIFGNIRGMERLLLTSNKLEANLEFLSFLSNCRQLEILGITSNYFTGEIPDLVGNLSTKLLVFQASYNQLTGVLPSTMSNLTSLNRIDVRNNLLTGTIPESITLMQNLMLLEVSSNDMSSPIPVQIGLLKSLQQLSLKENKFFGSIPNSVGNLTNLQHFSFLFHLDKLIYLNLSHNSLVGTLPDDVSGLKQAAEIDFSSNFLIGKIPNSFGQLRMLTYLNLSHNSFEDMIPYSFGELTSLIFFDLSFSNLSGTIPMFFANFNNTKTLNLSFNKLEGKIPEGGIFSNITLPYLIGNAGLCGAPRLGFSPCFEKSPSTDRHLLKFLIPTAIITFGSAALFVYLMIRRKIRNKKKTEPSSVGASDVVRHRLLSYHELVHATDNFCDDNLLGIGSFGKVFKGRLSTCLVVAIKVLDMQLEQAFRSFDAECRVLHMARHRNLIKVLNTCSNLDLRILPSNVLFDNNMTAHVSDFGIAKLLLGDDTSVITAGMAGTIGYMAPEYGSLGKASRKSDVFSFGIMLLEVFTGRRPTDAMFVGELNIRKWVHQAFPTDLASILDIQLLHDASCTRDLNDFLPPIFELGLVCSSDSPDQRMAMSDVTGSEEDHKGLHQIGVSNTAESFLVGTLQNHASSSPI
ncbi:hypothetical protein EJB05_50070, partial [Eragrostis curvula]